LRYEQEGERAKTESYPIAVLKSTITIPGETESGTTPLPRVFATSRFAGARF